MGSFHSIPSRSERRRTNRLSKPFTNKAYSSPISPKSSAASSHVSSPVTSSPPTWKDPWSGNSIPINSPVSGCHGFLPQSLPPVESQPENSRGAVSWNARCEPTINESHDEHLYDLSSPTSGTGASMSRRRPSLQPIRRASVQPDTSRSHSQSFVNLRQPKRSYSLQSYSQGTKSPIHENTLEEVTSSNTYFMVDSQRFSITRRRSLLTRPGVATRRSSSRQSIRRPSVVDKELKHSSRRSDERSKSLQPESEDSGAKSTSTSTRPVTPGDLGYTHLGALKLGSLRVVNVSTSPCSSDQTRSNMHPDSPPEASENVSTRQNHLEDFSGQGSVQDYSQTSAEEPRHSHKSFPEDISNRAASKALTSLLQLPSFSDRKGQEDLPGSPFSFEKSPTIALFPNQASFLPQEDEGISITNEGSSFDSDTSLRGNTHMEGSRRRKPSRPLAKADSGYSSTTSVRSLRRKHTGGSANRRHLEPESWGSCNTSVDSGFESHHVLSVEKSGPNRELPIQRRLSLRDSKPSYYSSVLDGYPTTCSIQPVRSNSVTRSSSLTAPRGLRRTLSSARPYAPLNSLESPVSDTGALPQAQQVEATRGQLSYASKPSSFRRSHHRSISIPNPNEQRFPGTVQNCPVDANASSCKQWQNAQISRTRSGPPRRFTAGMANQQCLGSNDNLPSGVFLPRLSTEAPLPRSSSFILGQMETVDEKDSGALAEASGDTTNQDIKNQQRRFVRPCRRRNDIHMATSPFIFH